MLSGGRWMHIVVVHALTHFVYALQDPLADGPTIQAAATRALQKGTTLDKVGLNSQMLP